MNICEPVAEYVLGELGMCELTGVDPNRLKRTCIKIACGKGDYATHSHHDDRTAREGGEEESQFCFGGAQQRTGNRID